MKILDLPKQIPLFPLSNFIIFPKTTVPLNIFEPRYIEMINNCMKSNKLLGMIQPKSFSNDINKPELHNIGCLGKITSFKETEDNRYLIDLKGIIRFKIFKEIKSSFQYREYEVDFKDYHQDLEEKQEKIQFSDLDLIFKDLKALFDKRGFIVNWKSLEKQSLNETINALSMASPFTLEEKQVLLEAKNLDIRKNKIAEILSTYSYDVFNNNTLQ
jgi:Lon protease-like protein